MPPKLSVPTVPSPWSKSARTTTTSPLGRSLPSVVAAAGLAGGFAVAQGTGQRQLGGALFAVAGIWCVRRWAALSGPGTAAALGSGYVAAMGGAHPLAKQLGPWPSVAVVTGLTVLAAELAVRRRRS